jgi:hypothetical protein
MHVSIFDSSTGDFHPIYNAPMLGAHKPDAVNPAMALWLAIEDHWRRVTDLERSAIK